MGDIKEFVCLKCKVDYVVKGDIPKFTCVCGGRVFRRKKD